ncbi:MAG: BtpA/SgcQ family protein [Oscillospiraceae bacterium]|nr:BtpA/SgcQ family protein [Oscillospiraceae bacterium]
MASFHTLFKTKPLIGMIHLLPLPGSPDYGGSMQQVLDAAMEDLGALERGGADSFIIENFGDVPYCCENEPVTLAAMTKLSTLIACETKLPFGVNVQFNCTEQEWALAYAVEADYIRVEAFVENRVGKHGVTYAAAPSLMRLRGHYPAKTLIFADINTKHTFPLVEQPTDFSVHEAIESGADALIITGLLTGQSPRCEDLEEIKAFTGDVPVLLGSGVAVHNAAEFYAVADGAIIGSSIKKDGDVFKRVDEERVRRLAAVIKG